VRPPLTFASGFFLPAGLAFDAAGNLFVTNDIANTVSEVKAGTTTPMLFASGFSIPNLLAVQATPAVPEPSTLIPALSGVALTGLIYAWRKRRRARAAVGHSPR
jgi:hypothetical protein